MGWSASGHRQSQAAKSCDGAPEPTTHCGPTHSSGNSPIIFSLAVTDKYLRGKANSSLGESKVGPRKLDNAFFVEGKGTARGLNPTWLWL